jgi:hypothetical protein
MTHGVYIHFFEWSDANLDADAASSLVGCIAVGCFIAGVVVWRVRGSGFQSWILA